MSTPIGHIEFLVKFDTMSQSFEKALRDAVQDVDVRVSGGFGWSDSTRLRDIESLCKEILYLIKERLRTPFTSSYRGFLSGVIPEISFAKSEETEKRLAEVLRAAPTAQRRFGIMSDKESREFAANIIDQYVNFLEKHLDKKLFQKEKGKLVDITGAFSQVLMGNWKYLIGPLFEQLIDKEFIGKQFEKRLKKLGVEARFKPQLWGRVEEPIEYEKVERVRKYPRATVKNVDELLRSMQAQIIEMNYERAASDILKRIFTGPAFEKIELETTTGRFLKKYFKKHKIEAEFLPTSMLTALELFDPEGAKRAWPQESRRMGTRKDLFGLIKERSMLEELEKFGVKGEKKEELEKQFERYGMAILVDSIKNIKERGQTVGLGTLFTPEEIATIKEEKRTEDIRDDVKKTRDDVALLLTKAESYSEKDLLESILRRLDELAESMGAPRTPKER